MTREGQLNALFVLMNTIAGTAPLRLATCAGFISAFGPCPRRGEGGRGVTDCLLDAASPSRETRLRRSS
jgi:hypothetical protein